jgi:ferredoxin-NADP reductase
MAANPKKLRIVDARLDNPSTRVLDIECVEGEPFANVGGKYVIVHTGIVVDGKPIKRAYSMTPLARAPHRARVTVKRIGAGVGSNALHDAPVGTELRFSGPWGKLVPEGGITEPTLVVATDTGITAALGVVEQDAPRPVAVALLWLRSHDETFLDLDSVRTRCEAAGVHFATATIPPVRDPGRAAAASAPVDALIAETQATLVVAAGDGFIIHALRDRLAGTPVRDVRLESFFHNPEKKIG